MSNVGGVNANNNIRVLDPSLSSQQDFSAAVYLERGNMLDAEVRKIVGEIEKSNSLLSTTNNLINKANVAQYGTTQYTVTTWRASGNNIVLDNGYGIALKKDAAGKTSFTMVDASGNQLIYQNQTLVPVAKGQAVDVVKVGIPVMNNMTLLLDDGTEITFETAAAGTPFNTQNLSGGLTDITSIYITRGNQGMAVTGLNTSNPVFRAPRLDGLALDAAVNDGHVLLESGGVHSWEYDGVNTAKMTRTDPNNANQQHSGFAARKLAFQNNRVNEISGVTTVQAPQTPQTPQTPAQQSLTASDRRIVSEALNQGLLTLELRAVVTQLQRHVTVGQRNIMQTALDTGTLTPELRPILQDLVGTVGTSPANQVFGVPVLTAQERNTLSTVLKVNYQDASGAGKLTPEEWKLLKTSLNNVKENLTGSNQLQTVRLQRAMHTYNQNYDAMSNSQNKIYSLLRDIINNVK